MSEPPEIDQDTVAPSFDATETSAVDPPRTLGGTLRYLGPGLIIAASIVGSGELIATTKTGAQAGISLLWLIIIGCLIKVFVQVELGRHAITHGQTTLAALNSVPGPRTLRSNWILWFWLAMMLSGMFQLGGIVGGVGQALAIPFPITGDYAAAIQMPSGSELKGYLEWDEVLLSEYDFSIARSEHDLSGARPEHVDNNAPETEDDPYSARHYEFEKMLSARAATTIADAERYHPGTVWIAGPIASALRTMNEQVREDGVEGPDRSGEYRQIRQERLKLQEALRAHNLARLSEALTARGQSFDDDRKLRLIQGHSAIAARLAEDASGRQSEALWTVHEEMLSQARLVEASQRLEELRQRDPTLDRRNDAVVRAKRILRFAEIDAEAAAAKVRAVIDPTTWDDRVWAAVIALITVGLLYNGRYSVVQHFSTVLVVLFTFITIGNVLELQKTPQWHIPLSEFVRGLSFQFPEGKGLATALATFGIIGVGASELVSYPYWCIEKGYARFTGRRSDDPAWAARARGWMRVMLTDAFVSMVIYTFATLAFFLMGVAVLHNEGRDPDGMRMVSTLAAAYVPVFGEYAKWLFLIGAFAVLFSTFLVAIAGHARTYTDAFKVWGLMDRNNQQAHDRSVSALGVALPLLSLATYLAGINPVRAILVAGLMQAILLPMLGFAALYFRRTATDPRLAPSRLWDVMLVISCLGLIVSGTWGVVSALR